YITCRIQGSQSLVDHLKHMNGLIKILEFLRFEIKACEKVKYLHQSLPPKLAREIPKYLEIAPRGERTYDKIVRELIKNWVKRQIIKPAAKFRSPDIAQAFGAKLKLKKTVVDRMVNDILQSFKENGDCFCGSKESRYLSCVCN